MRETNPSSVSSSMIYSGVEMPIIVRKSCFVRFFIITFCAFISSQTLDKNILFCKESVNDSDKMMSYASDGDEDPW